MRIAEIMNQFWNNKISKDEITLKYKNLIDESEFINSLEDAYHKKDAKIVYDTLLIGFFFKLITERSEPFFQSLLAENWHRKHEDIASLFQDVCNDNIKNIPILLDAMNNVPEYIMELDDFYPYVRKLIYAIGAQPEPYNIEALESLVSNTTDEEIKALALHQIEKRKKYGRWEANENE